MVLRIWAKIVRLSDCWLDEIYSITAQWELSQTTGAQSINQCLEIGLNHSRTINQSTNQTSAALHKSNLILKFNSSLQQAITSVQSILGHVLDKSSVLHNAKH